MNQEQVQKAREWLYTLRDHDHAMVLINEIDRVTAELIAENERLKHEAKHSDLLRLEAQKLYDIINKHSAEQDKEIQRLEEHIEKIERAGYV